MHRRQLRISGEFVCCLSLDLAKTSFQRTKPSVLHRWQEDVEFDLDPQNTGHAWNIDYEHLLISVWASSGTDQMSRPSALGRARVPLKALVVPGRPYPVHLGNGGIVVRLQARLLQQPSTRSQPQSTTAGSIAANKSNQRSTNRRLTPQLAAVSKPRLDFALVLPDELCLAVFEYLTVRDLARVSTVSKRWHCIADDAWLWKEMFRRGSSRVILLPPGAPIAPLLRCSSSLDAVAEELPLWKALCRLRYHCNSISEAIARARPGDRVLVAPGTYTEGIQLHKTVELIGLGAAGDVVVETRDRNSLISSAPSGVVRNITFRQCGESRYFCVDITDGSLVMEQCDLSSEGLSAVAVRGTASPVLRNNIIHDSKEAGVFLFDNTSALIERNHIHSNNVGGVEIRGGKSILRGNRITHNRHKGVLVSQGSEALLEENEITANTGIGVEIRAGANPTLRRNRICESQRSGVLLCDEDTHGLLLENDIFANSIAGVSICSGASPILSRNAIRDGKQSGVYIFKRGSGLLDQNDISNNALAGVEIKSGCNPILRNNKIRGSRQHGVYIVEGGAGVLEGNEIFENILSGVEVVEHAEPILRSNVIHHNGENGIYVANTARGVYHANEFYGNMKPPINVKEGASPILSENRILESEHQRKRSLPSVSAMSAKTFFDDNSRLELPLWEKEVEPVLVCNVQGPINLNL